VSKDRENSVEEPATRVFARKATGLVRQATLRDVFILNTNQMTPVLAVLFMLLLVPSLYPSANIYLATVIAFVCAIPATYVYAYLSTIYPRAGGDYVYVSRVLSPALGFMNNLSFCIWGVFYIGVAGVFLGEFGVAPLLRVLGAYTGHKGLADAGNWFAEPTGVFIMGVAVMVVFTAVFIFGGLRVFFRIQNLLVVVAYVSLGAVAIYLLLGSHGSALGHLDHAVKKLGGGHISSLASGGTSAEFSLRQTIYASIWAWLTFNSAMFSTYIGAEVRQPQRTQMVGIMGGLLWTGAWILLLTFGMMKLFGNTFLANLGNADSTKYGFSSTPIFTELAALGVGNVVVAVFMLVGVALLTYTWVGPYAMLLTRSAFAWSLDGLGPRKLAEVHPRWHSPVWAHVTMLVLGTIAAAFYAYGSLSVLVGTVGLTMSMMVVAIAGAALPYRRPELWSSSAGNGRILGIPTITVIGVISIPLLSLMIWALLADVNSGTSLEASKGVVLNVMIIFFVGLPVYYIARAVQKARGVNVDLAFKEIPPE
jgi:amino acid transporter